MPGCRAEYAVSWGKEFLSTPSARRATRSYQRPASRCPYFYPRPPRGGRRILRDDPAGASQFLSTPSARRATFTPPRLQVVKGISIHALREEGDPPRVVASKVCWIFLSTPSARRATYQPVQEQHLERYFYPRPPRGGRRVSRNECGDCAEISIHALREEGDWPRSPRSRGSWTFLSTPSARRATRGHPHTQSADSNFYPRPPRGGRPQARCSGALGGAFLSTPSARRATLMFGLHSSICHDKISIHALREEGDASASGRSSMTENFYPRPPRGGRPGAPLDLQTP